jgi:hypothetical protein
MKYTLISSDTSVSDIPVFNTFSQCIQYLKDNHGGHGTILDIDGNMGRTCKCSSRIHSPIFVKCNAKICSSFEEAQHYINSIAKGHGTIKNFDEKILQTCRCLKGNDRTKHPVAYCYESDEVY